MKQICILLAFFCSIYSYSNGQKMQVKSFNPKDYGICDAKTGIERYLLLKKAHTDAVTKGGSVSYKGLKTIDIEVPKGATPIPLTDHTDFAGVTINVKNNSRDIPLFAKSVQPAGNIDLAKHVIDEGDFSNIPALNKERIILSIKDENLWVDKRIGYSYGHTRRDILLIEDGHAINNVVMPYDNTQSKPRCIYYKASKEPTVIKDITFNRNPTSKAKTFFVEITGCNDVLMKNISVNTISNDSLTEDRIIRLSDCTNVTLLNIHINGTYSTKSKYGYGISMDNIWNFEADNLYAEGNWGVFGTKNTNTVLIKNSDINRFDIHCYGKDITFEHSVFSNLYNKFSSVYGNIIYRRCHFIDFTPYCTDYSYNAYVPVNLSFESCMWDITTTHHGLIHIGCVNDDKNVRPELSHKCWPNVSIHNMELTMNECVKTIVMFHVKDEVSQNCSVDYISDIKISNLKITGKPKDCKFKRFVLSDANVKTTSKITISVNKSNSQVDAIVKEFFFPVK